MILRFALSGTIVFEVRSDAVPPAGSSVAFVMRTTKKGIEAGTRVSAKVTADPEPTYDYLQQGEAVVTLDLDEFVIHGQD